MTPLATDDRDRAQRRPVGRGRRSPPRWRLTLAGHVPSAGGSAEHATQAAAESSGDSLLRPRKAPLSSPASGPACSAQGPSGARTEARAPRAPSRPRPLGRAATTARGHRPAGQRPHLQAAVCFIWTHPCPRLSPCPRCPSEPPPGPHSPVLAVPKPRGHGPGDRDASGPTRSCEPAPPREESDKDADLSGVGTQEGGGGRTGPRGSRQGFG